LSNLAFACWAKGSERGSAGVRAIYADMKHASLFFAIVIVALGHISVALGQTDEIKLEAVQPKITTVSAMRARRAPQVTAEEIVRLKLGTVVNAVARSTNQETIGGKTDYWYRVDLPNRETGWLFGGLLLDYNAGQRQQLLRQIIEARLKAENTDFADRQEIYNLAASAINDAKDVSTRAEFELFKVLATANSALAIPFEADNRSPYREWLKAHTGELEYNEFAGGHQLRAEVLWNLERKYHSLPIADRIAWEAAEMLPPSDCEGDEVCHFFLYEGEIKYLSLHPAGTHAADSVKNLTKALTDHVITFANGKGGDKYEVQQRTDLRKLLSSLRVALAKTAAPEKTELAKRLERVGLN
jgi:hypothetical protein